MNTVSSADSCGDIISRWWRGRAANKILLLAGVAAVVVYALGDFLSGLLYDGYSYLNQAISELSAAHGGDSARSYLTLSTLATVPQSWDDHPHHRLTMPPQHDSLCLR